MYLPSYLEISLYCTVDIPVLKIYVLISLLASLFLFVVIFLIYVSPKLSGDLTVLYCTYCIVHIPVDLCVDHSFYNRFFSCFAGFLKSVFTNVSQYFFCYFYSCCFVNFFLHFAWFFFFGCILVFLCYSIDAVSLSFPLFDSLF